MMSTDILELCDRVVGEVGRREHRFAWLVAPGAGPGEWLAVDAYYPARRLVVVLDTADPLGELCSELMAQHGLHLLRVASGDLGPDRAAAEPALEEMLAALRLPERRTEAPEAPPRAPVRLEDAFARVAASFASAAAPAPPVRPVRPSQAEAAQRAARVVAAHRASPPRARPVARVPRASPPRRSSPRPAPQRRSPPRPTLPQTASGHPQAASAVPTIGLALVLGAIVAAELYLGVARLGGDAGLWGLALGLAIDACTRILGTSAARRSGAPRAAWTCAIVGSPAVALFTLFGSDGPVSVDPAPLAGLLSVIATLLVGVSLLGLLLGF